LEVSELINTFLLPLGGVSTFVMALAAFLGNVNTKRIVHNELAQHKLNLENLQSKNKISLETLKLDYTNKLENQKLESAQKLENIQSENKIRLETLKLDYTNKLENQKLEGANHLEKIKTELEKDIIKHDIYSAMSKEKFQELFQKRIDVYETLINIKNEIDKSFNDDVSGHFFMDYDPQSFANSVKKVNEATRKNTMLVSNELASLSEELFETSSPIFLDAKAGSTYIHHYGKYDEDGVAEMSMEVENKALSQLTNKCFDIYTKWFEQLEIDVSKIRSTLDLTSDFIGNKH